MGTVSYVITKSIVKVEEESICSYGIACVENGKQTHLIEDISTNRQLVEHAATSFNKLELLPEHFDDAVEDVVTESVAY